MSVDGPDTAASDPPVLVTGAGGFIGFHLCRRLLDAGRTVVGIDALQGCADPAVQHGRVELLRATEGFTLHELDCADEAAIGSVFGDARPNHVVHLAAQPGVRHSVTDPQAYLRSNLMGFGTVLDACRIHDVAHFVYASSSSVYGDAAAIPFDVHNPADHPMSLYAATKRSNELMAHSYSDLFGLATTGLRFFTVYGPWGRPDMAYFRFADAIMAGEPVTLYGDGSVVRDFTYVDDVIDALVEVVARPPEPGGDFTSPATSRAPFRLFNVGHGGQTTIAALIELLESTIGRRAVVEHRPAAPGDAARTHAETGELIDLVGFAPKTPLSRGLPAFVEWLTDYRRSGSPPD